MSGSIEPTIAVSPTLCDTKKAAQGSNSMQQKSEKNPKDVKIVRYCDYREARKAAQRKNIAHPLSQQLAKLDLNRASIDNRNIINYDLNQNHSQDFHAQQQQPQEKYHKPSQSISHSLSVGLLKPKTLRESHELTTIQSKKPFAHTSRQDKSIGRKDMGQPEEVHEIFYTREYQPTEEAQTKRGTPLAYMKVNTASQESLLKSLRLRQDMCTRRSYEKTTRKGSGEYKVKDYDRESIERRESGGFTTMFTGMTTRRREDEEGIYNKNVKWLLNKQKKLDDMQTKEIEEEMKECTFKPQLVTKELNAKGDFDYDSFALRGRNKPSEQLSKMLSVDQRY